ncbi:MAG: hypothetical protein KDK36_07885, partial [Leptospiraceae bacterium]|nr:hypothetical protein [Leptospiraceae bacterium]
ILILSISLFAFALIAQADKKPIPSSTSVDTNSEVIDTVITTKDTVSPTTRETTESTTTTTTTTTTTSSTTEAGSAVPTDGTQALYVNYKSTFELLSEDDLSTVDFVEYKINDGEYVKYTGPISLSKEGATTVTYRAVDKVGNREAAQVLNFIVDNTPPTANIKPVEPLFKFKNTVYASTKNSYIITAEDGSAGVKEIIYNIDNEEKQKYTDPIKLEKQGFHVINYYAIDNAGNQSPEQSFVVNIDTIKPTVEITESQPFVKVNDKQFARVGTTFKVTAKDGESGIAKTLVKVDGETEFKPYVEELSFTTSGEHKIEAKAVDNVGNESDVVTLSFFYDVKAPQTNIKAVSN